MKTTSEELTVFVQVVENGSFSRAANQLSMANSAVSRVVKRLEEKLGVNLINRTTRQLRLTEEGSQYFRRVQKILQEMAAAEAEMLAVHEVPQGVLRVDSAMPMVLHLLVPLAAKFNERYPHIQLSLVSSEGYINLIERKVDIALRAGELDDSGLRARHLFDSHFRLVASPEYLAKHGTPQSTEDLANHQCLGFTEPRRGGLMKPSMPTNGTALGASGVLLTTAGDCLPAWLICMMSSMSFCVPAFAHFFSISRLRPSEITTSFIEPLPLSATITLPVTKTPAPPFAQVS